LAFGSIKYMKIEEVVMDERYEKMIQGLELLSQQRYRIGVLSKRTSN
jgi:hypothetical protein